MQKKFFLCDLCAFACKSCYRSPESHPDSIQPMINEKCNANDAIDANDANHAILRSEI